MLKVPCVWELILVSSLLWSELDDQMDEELELVRTGLFEAELSRRDQMPGLGKLESCRTCFLEEARMLRDELLMLQNSIRTGLPLSKLSSSQKCFPIEQDLVDDPNIPKVYCRFPPAGLGRLASGLGLVKVWFGANENANTGAGAGLGSLTRSIGAHNPSLVARSVLWKSLDYRGNSLGKRRCPVDSWFDKLGVVLYLVDLQKCVC